MLKGGLESTQKDLVHMCSRIVKIRMSRGMLKLNKMPVRLIFMKLLKRI